MFMYVHRMEQTNPTPDGITIPQAAALVGVREFEVREAIAAGTIPHQYRIVVATTDVHRWHDARDAS